MEEGRSVLCWRMPSTRYLTLTLDSWGSMWISLASSMMALVIMKFTTSTTLSSPLPESVTSPMTRSFVSVLTPNSTSLKYKLMALMISSEVATAGSISHLKCLWSRSIVSLSRGSAMIIVSTSPSLKAGRDLFFLRKDALRPCSRALSMRAMVGSIFGKPSWMLTASTSSLSVMYSSSMSTVPSFSPVISLCWSASSSCSSSIRPMLTRSSPSWMLDLYFLRSLLRSVLEMSFRFMHTSPRGRGTSSAFWYSRASLSCSSVITPSSMRISPTLIFLSSAAIIPLFVFIWYVSINTQALTMFTKYARIPSFCKDCFT